MRPIVGPCVLFLLLLTPTYPSLQEVTGTTDYRIDKLLFEGLALCPPAWPPEILDLRSGDVTSLTDLKSRSGRLLEAGVFHDVRYKYLIRGSEEGNSRQRDVRG